MCFKLVSEKGKLNSDGHKARTSTLDYGQNQVDPLLNGAE